MKLPLLAMAAVLCNVCAQLASKAAGNVVATAHGLAIGVALVFYAVSFWLTLKVFAANSLIVAGPVMAGATFMLVPLAAYLVFDERLDALQALGVALIFSGIVLISRFK